MGLNSGWEFTGEWSDAFLAGEPLECRTVELPHTCALTPYNCFDESIYQMLCGYRRRIRVPEAWAGKRVFLNVGAAAHRARVYVNGKLLNEHNCGYTAFRTELTSELKPNEEALIAISVDSRECLDIPPFGFVIDYMTYGGIYREASLEIREQTHISDVFVMADAEGEAACKAAVSGECKGFALRRSIIFNGEIVAADEHRLEALYSEPVEEGDEFTLPKLTVKEAKLWDIDSPSLYVQRTELIKDGSVLDSVETRFGFRTAQFKAEGFFLNGKRIKLRGLNRHQSYPYIGYAAPASIQRFDADILKNELGCNAVRTSHYPQSQHFTDRCDELGLLVFTEIPGWQHIGGDEWKKQAVQNTVEMVEQYRNHPSVILWGVRINESRDDDGLYNRTNAIAHALDPTRQTGGVRCYKKGSLLEDVFTYNDFFHDGTNAGVEKKKKVTPDIKKPYLVTEYNGHMFPTKAFDCEEHRLDHALRHANVLNAVAGEDDIAGSFGWCMADYNTHRDFGSGDRICYHGVCDMFRNKKLAAAVYASQQEQEPVLEISSSMDIGEHPAANRGKLYAFTNADSVRLYKNGRFIKEFAAAGKQYSSLLHPPIEIDDLIGSLIDDESFAPKQAEYVRDLINYSSRYGFSHLKPKHLLRAAWLMLRYRMSFEDAYALYGKYNSNWGDEATLYRFDAIKGGETVRSVFKGPMRELRLNAEASSYELCEGMTYDAALIRITMRDEHDNVQPYYNEAVLLETEGPIELIGPRIAQLRGGMGGAYIKTRGEAGEAKLRLIPLSGAPAELDFTVKIL